MNPVARDRQRRVASNRLVTEPKEHPLIVLFKNFQRGWTMPIIAAVVCCAVDCLAADDAATASSYRRLAVEEQDGQVVATKPLPDAAPARWAKDVSQQPAAWSGGPDAKQPYFKGPIPFVIAPEDAGEPFHRHNHQPAITWLKNGDLLAIWYSTGEETGTELTVLASRLRTGANAWDPSSEFFKAEQRNMHGSAIFYDGRGSIFHINGMAPRGGEGWSRLALLMRSSADNGVTWTAARPISSGANYQKRHQVIAGTLLTNDGTLVQVCDATPGGEGPSAIHLSRDGGKTWSDPGGEIRGIHAGVTELKDGRLFALGRGQAIDGRMPISISDNLGRSWTYHASPFPPIGSGQRLVLLRLREGPLMAISFTSGNRRNPTAGNMTFQGKNGQEFTGHGMFAALSNDDGATWPVRKLLTPGAGEFDGGGHTRFFTASPTRAEHAGYLAATQSPDGVIHLISSRLHYRFNLAWLNQPSADAP
jgi:formylglycine-generating enzyme